MGYYTDYELELQGKGPIYDRLKEKAYDIELCYSRSLEQVITDGLSEVKWYDHEEDLNSVSKDWPNVMFVLTCLGEDGERWRVYSMNGVAQKVPGKVLYEEPDYSKFPYRQGAEEKARAERKAELQAALEKVQAELDKLG
jgi:hypothetical protein